ncbi:hypothetical protein ACFQS2_13565 [Brachybacterium sp. GCM10030267]|uniref:hypothetical protein n=1 Tax=unclassified Brachybacterium TaxID=2623841 RepID=UPI003612CB65
MVWLLRLDDARARRGARARHDARARRGAALRHARIGRVDCVSRISGEDRAMEHATEKSPYDMSEQQRDEEGQADFRPPSATASHDACPVEPAIPTLPPLHPLSDEAPQEGE